MPNFVSLTCPACGANVPVATDADHVSCAYCGNALAVERSEGEMALQISEELTEAIHTSGAQTADAVRHEGEKTQEELRRMQLTQERTQLSQQLLIERQELAELEREHRALMRYPAHNREIQRQINELRQRIDRQAHTVQSLQAEIRRIDDILNPKPKRPPQPSPRPPGRRRRGGGVGAVLIVVAIVLVTLALSAGCLFCLIIPILSEMG